MALQIDFICSQKTDEAILMALEDLPNDLSNIYDRVLQKLLHSNADDLRICREIFELVAAAQRPLTLEELCEAVFVKPGATSWDASKLVDDMHTLLFDCCGSVVAVDEAQLTVHFAHHSVKKYLLSEPTLSKMKKYHINMKEADLYMGDIIVTYLNLGGFYGQLAKIEGGSKEQTQPVHPFLSYAQEYWLFHTKFFKPASVAGYDLWQHLIDDEVETIELPWAPKKWQDFDDEYIEWIIQNEHWALIDRSLAKFIKEPSHHAAANLLLKFLEKNATDINDQNINLDAVLYVASYLGNKTVVLLVLGKGADTNAVSGKYGTALTAASRSGHEEIAGLLLDSGANFSAEVGDYGSVSQPPPYHGHEETARELLLEHGVKVNADPQATAGQPRQAISNDTENLVIREIPEKLNLEAEKSVREGPNSSGSTNDRTILESHDEASCNQRLGPLDRLFALSSRLFQAVGLQYPPLEAGKVRVQWKCVSSNTLQTNRAVSIVNISIDLRALDVR